MECSTIPPISSLLSIEGDVLTSAPLRYKVIRRLGAGGMGEVFLAEDSVLSRKLALKILPADAHDEPMRRSRFMQEARAAAMLNHPNICTVFDVGEWDERIFISMEYIEGPTLAEHARGRQLPLADVIDIAVQAAEAMQEAHGKGVIHRDLKPSNLMLTPRGQLKVVDFGLAKIETSVSAGADTQTEVRTSPGQTMGTLPYMSPEQLHARDIDRRSDIFSFGTILHELTAGQHPFLGATAAETMDRILNRQPPPIDIARAPERWERIIRKCLQKDAENRYQSMVDVLVDLRAVQRDIWGELPQSPDAVPESKGRLPLPFTSFVGREQEIEELGELLTLHRLLTITGPGGGGKTRLALEVAGKRRGSYRHGVWFVDLARIVDPALVTKSIAAVLGVKETQDRPLIESISANLQQRQALMIIDNCEHLIEETARVTEVLLRDAPDLTILATSREPLNLAGECTWSVPPLAAPPGGRPLDVHQAQTYDAVRLFTERAKTSQPRFALSAGNVESVAAICRQLDGIPLAIELAAARVRAMAVDEICTRLEDAFLVLVGGTRNNLPRQLTMRATVAWSHDLLTPEEKLLYRRLSCFAGGFDVPAVEEICSGEPGGHDVLNTLTRLVEKSLVVADLGEGAEARYRLLAPIRQYARERLMASGDAEDLDRRHFLYYSRLAENAYEERIESAGPWIERLEREHDNLRAALRWAAEHDPNGELQLAGALAWFWQLHAHHSEARTRLRAVLSTHRERTREVARALWGASTIALWQWDPEEARRAAEESLSIWRELDDKKEVALALEAIGLGLFMGDNAAGALASFEESARMFQELGDERLINRANLNIVLIHVSDGDVARARPLAERALAIALGQHDLRQTHAASHFLADCALMDGDAREAERLYATTLRAALDYGERMGAIYELEGLAMAVAGQKRADKALRLAGAADAERAVLEVVGSPRFWTALKARYLGAAERMRPSDSERLRAEGKKMGFEAAASHALAIEED